MHRAERALAVVATATILSSFALASIATVEVLFLLRELGASFSLVGSILGPAALAFLLFVPQIRYLASRIGKVKFLVWTFLLLGCAAIGAALLRNPALYLAPKIVLALLGPLSLPVLREMLQEEYRFARARDRMLFAMTLLSAVGGTIGAWIAGSLAAAQGLPAGYALAAGAFIVAGFVMLAASQDRSAETSRSRELHGLVRVADVIGSPFAMLAGVGFVTQLLWSVRDFALPVLITDLGHDVAGVGVVFAIGALGSVLGLISVRWVLVELDPREVLMFSMLTLSIAIIALAFSPYALIIVLMFVAGLAAAASLTAVADLIREQATGDRQEEIMAGVAAMGALAWFFGPILTGIFLEAGVSSRMVLFACGLLAAYVFSALRARRTSGGGIRSPTTHIVRWR